MSTPTIVTQPQSQVRKSNFLGWPIYFSVVANGNNLRYQWQVYNINEWDNIRNSAQNLGATTATYGKNSDPGSMTRRFRCKVWEDGDEENCVYSDEATLSQISNVWTSGTAEEVCELLDAAAAGNIDLHQDAGWDVGDVRKIPLAAFTGGNGVVSEAKTIYVAISSFDEYNNCGNLLQFDVVSSPQSFRMYEDAPGHPAPYANYQTSEMNTVTLPAFASAFPQWFKTRMKPFSVYAHKWENNVAVPITVPDVLLALRSADEIFIASTYPVRQEGLLLDYYKNSNQQFYNKGQSFDYYPLKFDANKQRAYDLANLPYVESWWTRSAAPTDNYGSVYNTSYTIAYVGKSGSKHWFIDTSAHQEVEWATAPFGCLGGIDTLPTITTQPGDQIATRGNTVTFLIAAQGATGYQWQVSEDSGSTWSNYTKDGATTSYISFTASTQNGYQYRCQVSNAVGTVTSNAATLTIETPSYPPTITTQPQNQTVASGSSATFSVTASGNDMSYQWQTYRNGAWSSIGGATSASYTVAGADSLNGSKYHCIVSNEAGAVISGEATLTVTAAQEVTTPTVTTHPQSVTVQEGSAASFRVAASGGGLSYQWQVNNGGTWYDVSGATNAAYNFKTVLGDNGKQYRCVVSNAAGTVTSNAAILTVTQKPDQPTPITPLPSRYKYYMIDGVDILPYIIEKGIRWSRNDVDGENAGRVIGNAEMNRDRLAIKMRCDISCRPLYDNEASIVLRVIEPEFVTVQYYDPMYGNVTKIMYSNNGAATQGAIYDDGVGIWDDITFPLIEK